MPGMTKNCRKNQFRYDEDTNKLDRQLRNKVLSQKEYDRQIRALEEKKRKEDGEIKKREFERNQQSQALQALISGAAAVVEALKLPPPFDAIKAILVGATTIAKIAIIKSQKSPEFEKGGILPGPSHSQGGLPVINPKTGKKVAELEGGEPILSRRTYFNNRDLIDQLLYASMFGNGARITPYWQQRPYHTINYTAMTRTIERVNHYERGGVFKRICEQRSVCKF